MSAHRVLYDNNISLSVPDDLPTVWMKANTSSRVLVPQTIVAASKRYGLICHARLDGIRFHDREDDACGYVTETGPSTSAREP